MLALTAEGSDADAPDAVYDYSPYGEQSSEMLEDSQAGDLNAFGYTGAYQFQDGTVHLSHRFPDTLTHNFTQPDPSRQEMNNSTYVACDPINNTDPDGLLLRNLTDCQLATIGVVGSLMMFVGGIITGLAGAKTLVGAAAGLGMIAGSMTMMAVSSEAWSREC